MDKVTAFGTYTADGRLDPELTAIDEIVTTVWQRMGETLLMPEFVQEAAVSAIAHDLRAEMKQWASKRREAVQREIEELRGVIETYGRVTLNRVPNARRVDLHYTVMDEVIRAAGSFDVFSAAIGRCRSEWNKWLATPATGGKDHE